MNLRLKHLSVDDYRVMPWKNGGGSTTELAIDPPDSTMGDPFHWRLSLAQLNGSGPFSSFPGYDRVIAQLSGLPMTLIHHKGERHEKPLEFFTPYPFSGDWETEGKLDGQAEDFNLMLKRDAVTGSLENHHLKASKALTFALARTTVLWVFRGELIWESQGQRKALKTRDTLIIESSGHERFQLAGENAFVLVAKINPKI